MKSNILEYRHEKCSTNQWRAIIMMSGTWSNARQVLENKIRFNGLDIIGLFSDNKNSSIQQISTDFNLSYIIKDSVKFNNMSEREQYFNEVSILFRELKVNILIYAWFMKIVPYSFLKEFPWINSHPADLLIKDWHWEPKYIWMWAVENTINDWQTNICCSCCYVDYPVDTGKIISQSEKILIQKTDSLSPEALHERLKKMEHLYYSDTIAKLCNWGIKSFL